MSLFITYPHHSASSINDFIDQRPKWFLGKFKGIRAPGNPFMHRGTAVEHGVNHYFQNKDSVDFGDCASEAAKKFEELCLGMNVTQEIRDSIRECTKVALSYFCSEDFEHYGEVPTTQEGFVITLDGLNLPVKGYFDFNFKEKVHDLKVVNRTPSEMNQRYIIQGALYRQATGKPVVFDYIVPLKTGVKHKSIELTDEQFEWGMRQVINYGKVIEKIINLTIDPDILQLCFSPDPSAFYNDTEMKFTMDNFGL